MEQANFSKIDLVELERTREPEIKKKGLDSSFYCINHERRQNQPS